MDPRSSRTSPIDISSPEFSRDPIAGCARLRAQSGLSWHPVSSSWLVTGYDDSLRLLRSRGTEPIGLHRLWLRLKEKYGYDFPAATDIAVWAPFNYSGDRHAALRRTFARTLARYTSADGLFVRRLEQLLEPLRRMGGFDLAGEFANRILFEIFCDLAAIAETDRPELVELSRSSWAIESTISMKQRALLEVVVQRAHRFLLHELDVQLNRSSDTLLTAIYQELAPDVAEPNSVAATVFSILLIMGNDALGGSLALGIRQILQQRGAFAVDQRAWSHHSDDMLRYTATVNFLTRRLTQPLEIGGVALNPGERIMASPLAANHDTAEFGPHADKIGAVNKGVGLTFGAGVHICVGMQIARRIMNLALEALGQLPTLEMDGAAEPVGNVVRTLGSMPVRLR